jgi:hypothetical protein
VADTRTLHGSFTSSSVACIWYSDIAISRCSGLRITSRMSLYRDSPSIYPICCLYLIQRHRRPTVTQACVSLVVSLHHLWPHILLVFDTATDSDIAIPPLLVYRLSSLSIVLLPPYLPFALNSPFDGAMTSRLATPPEQMSLEEDRHEFHLPTDVVKSWKTLYQCCYQRPSQSLLKLFNSTQSFPVRLLHSRKG